MPTLLGPDGRALRRPQQRMARNHIEHVHQWSGTLLRPDQIGLDTYEKMVDTDETIGAAIDFLALSVCAKLGEYTHPKRKFQKFIRECFGRMRGSLAMAVEEMLTAMWAGFSVTEICLKSEGGRWMLDQLVTLNPLSVHFGLDLQQGSRSYGELQNIWQWRWTGWETQLNPGQCIVYSHQGRHGNPYGRSKLKRAYAPWYIKTALLPAWGRALERYGSPLTVGKTPNATQPALDHYGNDTGVSQGEYFLDRLKELISGACMVLEEGEEVTFEGLSTALGDSHEAAQNHLNKMLLRAIGLPSLVFDNTDVGSYSLGEKHYDVFIMGLEFLLLEVREVLLEQLVRRLLFWNFGWTGELGEFAGVSLQPEDQAALIAGYVQLTDSGYMTPELKADLDHVRKKVGLEIVESLPYTPPALPAQAAPPGESAGEGDDEGGSPGATRRRKPRPRKPSGGAVEEVPEEMRMRLLRDVSQGEVHA